MTVLDEIGSFSFDQNREEKFGVKSGIVYGHSNTVNAIYPLLYISKPKHLSQEDFDLLLSKLDISIRR
jgi:hypothetical protein